MEGNKNDSFISCLVSPSSNLLIHYRISVWFIEKLVITFFAKNMCLFKFGIDLMNTRKFLKIQYRGKSCQVEIDSIDSLQRIREELHFLWIKSYKKRHN